MVKSSQSKSVGGRFTNNNPSKTAMTAKKPNNTGGVARTTAAETYRLVVWAGDVDDGFSAAGDFFESRGAYYTPVAIPIVRKPSGAIYGTKSALEALGDIDRADYGPFDHSDPAHLYKICSGVIIARHGRTAFVRRDF